MNLYAIVIGIIILSLLVVSLTRVSKVKTKADYLVAGRSASGDRAYLHFAELPGLGRARCLRARRMRITTALLRCGSRRGAGRGWC